MQTCQNKILNSIENGLYAVGDTLPGEFELMKQFSVSRDTVRKALQLLAQNGYIQKSQGRGSIVLDFNRFDFPLSGVISFKEVASAMHEPVSTEVICFEKIHPDARIASILQMRSEEEVWFIQRVRRISNEAVILDTDILNAEIIPGLTRKILSMNISKTRCTSPSPMRAKRSPVRTSAVSMSKCLTCIITIWSSAWNHAHTWMMPASFSTHPPDIALTVFVSSISPAVSKKPDIPLWMFFFDENDIICC